MSNVVAACCVLHNTCENFQEDFDDHLLATTGATIEESWDENHTFNDDSTENSGENVRAALVQYCKDVPLLNTL